MINISIIGTDSTHTEEYVSLINSDPNLCVTSIFGDNKKQTYEKADKLNISNVSSRIDDSLKNTDLVMVLGRYGESHFAPALKVIKHKIPLFVDKPFTVDSIEAKKLIDKSINNKLKMMSSSPLRFCDEIIDLKKILIDQTSNLLTINITVPAECNDLGNDPRLDSVFFYGIHGIEMLFELIGDEITEHEIYFSNSKIDLILKTPDKKTHSLSLIYGASEFYDIDVYFKSYNIKKSVKLDSSYYKKTLKFIVDDFLNGSKSVSLQSTYNSIFLLEEIEKLKPKK